MSFEHSFKDNAPGLIPPPPPSPWKKRARIAMFALAGLIVLLLVVRVSQSLISTANIGNDTSGTVVGMVLDDSGRPVAAELIIERTELSVFADADGRFELREVPTGPQFLVVGYQGFGAEYPIQVLVGQTTDVGIVQPATTAIPLD
jgi:hypothetical protein